MGRRSINTTKSGKYMNPTDQARKEARKKELKKNKKQRQMVRAAVLKGKDPQQIIQDLEKIDQMEYNVLQPSPLNEKVLKDKRKKLKDTLDRVLKMYMKDDPDKWAELKRLQNEYDRKRAALFSYYEAVRNAQQVQIDDIPLPINTIPAELQAVYPGMPSQIPLPTLAPPLMMLRPSAVTTAPPGILKKTSAYLGKDSKKEPPGVPPGPPPSLRDLEDPLEISVPGIDPIELVHTPAPVKKSLRFAEDDEPHNSEEEMVNEDVHDKLEDNDSYMIEPDEEPPSPEPALRAPEEDLSQRPTSLQQKMLAMAGQDIDQFMKEMEQVHKKRKADKAADLELRLQAINDKVGTNTDVTPSNHNQMQTSEPRSMSSSLVGPGVPEPIMPPGTTIPPNPGLLPGLPPMMFRPPPPRGVPSLMGIRLPPGPPPGLPPRLGLRLPPGPPPGLPPRLMRPPTLPPAAPVPTQNNVLSAGPQLISRPTESGTTIQAQAQIRNLSADVTRFIPSALRVKRDDKNKSRPKSMLIQDALKDSPQLIVKPGQTKDDAYQQFMKEMEGLI